MTEAMTKKTRAIGKRGSKAKVHIRSSLACNMVLSIPELLESILLQLDMQTLLVSSQRVCRQWHNFIKSSRCIQEFLFFEPCSQLSPRFLAAGRVKNPLLKRHFKPFFEDLNGPKQARRQPWSTSFNRFGVTKLTGSGLAIADMKNGRHRHAAFVREGASWRRMLVTQPPIERVAYIKSGPWNVTGKLEYPLGLIMGQFYDLIFAMLWDRTADGESVAWLGWRPPSDGNNNEPPPLSYSRAGDQLFRSSGAQLLIGEDFNLYGNVYCKYKHRPWNEDKCGEMHARYQRQRTRQSTKWMFQCEEYESVPPDRAGNQKLERFY